MIAGNFLGSLRIRELAVHYLIRSEQWNPTNAYIEALMEGNTPYEARIQELIEFAEKVLDASNPQTGHGAGHR